jgi:uncharacterized membrane protein YphA (DoxX/SURF4 family)
METLEIRGMVDVGLRVYLIGFIAFLVLYRDRCFGDACAIHRERKKGVFLRIAAGVFATIGFFVPIAGAVLSIVLVFAMWNLQYAKAEKVTSSIARKAIPAKSDGMRERRRVPIGRES